MSSRKYASTKEFCAVKMKDMMYRLKGVGYRWCRRV